MVLTRLSSSRLMILSMLSSRKLKNPLSQMMPYLITSARPAESCLLSSVLSVSVSITTDFGWWKAPIMFFPSGWLTPVFPPTEESTWASSVVAHWMKSTPLW